MEEISLMDILKIIYKRKVILGITIFIAILAAALTYYFRSSNVYEYAATIYTKGDYLNENRTSSKKDKNDSDSENKNEDTVIKELQIGEQLTKDYMNFLDSTYVLENMQVKLKEKYKDFKSYSYNDMNNYIKAKIAIKAKGVDSRFMVVSASDKNPDLAKDIVKTATDELKKSAVDVLGAGSVNIVDISLVNESNNTFTNSGIIFGIVMLFGIFAVFIMEFLDDTIGSLEQVENGFGIKLIGDVPEY